MHRSRRRPHSLALIVGLSFVQLSINVPAFSQGGQGGRGGLGGGGFGGGGVAGAPLRDTDTATFTHILTPGDRGEWPITAREGETIIVRVSSAVFDPAVEVVDSDGKVLVQNDDIRPGEQDALALLRFPRPGSYKILVKGFKSAAGGQYRLTLTRFVALDAALGARTAATLGRAQARWIRFHGAPGQTLALTVRAAEFDPQIAVYRPTGEALDTEAASVGTRRTERAVFRVDSADDYYARIAGDRGAASFAVTLAAARTYPMTIDSPAAARALETGGLDLWTFPAAEGDLVRIEARSQGVGLTLRLSFVPAAGAAGDVEGADESELATSLPSDPKTTGEQVALLRKTGTYEVAVSNPLGLPSDYRFAVTRAARPWKLAPDAASALRIGSSDYWRIEGDRGQLLRIAGSSQQFDVALELFNARGEHIDGNDDGGDSRNALMTALLPEKGAYLLRVHAFGDGGGGEYRLHDVADPLHPLSPGGKHDGVIGAGGVEIWLLRGKAGQTIVLSVRSEEFDTFVQLFGPDGLEVASNDDGGDGTDSLLSVRLPVDGTYTVWVTGRHGGGRYHIRWLDLDR